MAKLSQDVCNKKENKLERFELAFFLLDLVKNVVDTTAVLFGGYPNLKKVGKNLIYIYEMPTPS
jgi:hypothetical protein